MNTVSTFFGSYVVPSSSGMTMAVSGTIALDARPLSIALA
jgi:hypothetical protein